MTGKKFSSPYEEVKDTARDILYQLRVGKLEEGMAVAELAALQVVMLAEVAERLHRIEKFGFKLPTDQAGEE